MRDRPHHSVDVRDRPAFLRQILNHLAGETAIISFEGDLSRFQAGEKIELYVGPCLLTRQTSWPELDFILVRLIPSSVEGLMKRVMAVGLKRSIVHIQIERGGSVEFRAYDHFHPECVVTGPNVSEEFLCELQQSNVIRSIKPVTFRE